MSMWKYGVVVLAVVLAAAWAFGAEEFPAGAKGFAGMISGKVVSKGKDEAVVQVVKIEQTWKHSKAENAEALVGKSVTVRVNPDTYKHKKEDGYLAKVRKFFEAMKVDDTEKFDVKHAEGDALIFLELTKEQAERVTGGAKAKEAGGAGEK